MIISSHPYNSVVSSPFLTSVVPSLVSFRAKGLQSVVQLMGEKDLYDFWSDAYKVHSLDWSSEMAAEILAEWQQKFSAEVTRLTSSKRGMAKYEINAFSSFQLDRIMEEFSEFSFVNLGVGYLLMVIKFCISEIESVSFFPV